MLERKQRAQRKRKIRLLKLGIWIVIVVIVIRWIISLFHSNDEATLAAAISITPTSVPLASETPTELPSPTASPTPSTTNSSGLETAVQNALTGTHGSYGVVVKNLKTNESYSVNADTQYESGSLYKLWVMASVFEQIKEGKLHENDKLSESVEQLNKHFYIDPDSAEKTSGTISLTVHDALEQMITISDNYAALLLSDKVTLSSLSSFLQTNGFKESQVGVKGNAPMTTPSDIALFFEKLYKGELTDQQYTEEMIGLLKRQRLNEKIPKYLPSGISVAHKTGELDDFTHDAGIVYTDNGDYIIVVLSKSDSRDLANERIANVSQAIYNYFETSQE